MGGQAVAKVVRIAVRAVVASWTGMATVALKAVRTWQVRATIVARRNTAGQPVIHFARAPGRKYEEHSKEKISAIRIVL